LKKLALMEGKSLKTLINATVYDYVTFIENGYVIMDEFIHEVGPMSNLPTTKGEVIDCLHQLVIPGMLLMHTHIYSTFARGLSLPFHPHNFQDILDQLWWKLDSKLDNELTYSSGIVFARDSLLRGVTTIFDHHASGSEIIGSLTALKDALVVQGKQRACLCFETSDRFNLEECIQENVTFFENNKTSSCRGMFGLHASMSLSTRSLQRIASSSKQIPIHIHVAESGMDQANSMHHYQKRVIHRLAEHGLLRKNSLLVHGLFLLDSERLLISKHQAKVVLNPNSNQNNGVGFPTPNELLEAEVPFFIGNDGMSPGITSEYLSLLFLTRLKHFSPSAFGLQDIKNSIISAYEYASHTFEVGIGRITKGFVSDLLIIPYIPPTPMNEQNVFGHLFYGLFDSFRPRHVFINGQQVVTDFSSTAELESLYLEASKKSTILWNRLKKEEL
jgi:cytosine/adenosine deaminase-related metal-dependent hydrolase